MVDIIGKTSDGHPCYCGKNNFSAEAREFYRSQLAAIPLSRIMDGGIQLTKYSELVQAAGADILEK